MKPITPRLTSLLARLLDAARRLVEQGFALGGPRPLPAYVRCRPPAGIRPVLKR